jgi:predicted RNase H-like nuclease (RuvC/YqgF family)
LGRISQSNIDFKTRSERLEAANAELSSELDQLRTRVSTLEMELEMTKENADHDFEKQVELIRAELNEHTLL